MFEKKKRTPKKPTEPLMFYSRNDLFYNSYLTEALDAQAIRALHFILKRTNNTKTKFNITYQEIREGAELSCNNHVKRSLDTLKSLGIIGVSVVKKVQTIQVLKTAQKLNAKKIS